MSDHELFKMKKELVQQRKIIEQQKSDLKIKESKLIDMEVSAELWRDQAQALEQNMIMMREQLNEKERLIIQDDPMLKENLRRQLAEKSEALEQELIMQRKLQEDLGAKDAQIREYHMQLREAAIKYKDDTILQDAENYRDEVMANRLKVQGLVEKHNQMNQALEQLSAENRVLRKMAGVPDDYQFELDDIKQEGQLQVEKYRGQVRALEEEVEEQQEEIARLRRRLRENAMGGENMGDEAVDHETKRQLKREIEDHRSRIKQLEQECLQLRMETNSGPKIQGNTMQKTQGLDELMKQNVEMKDQLTQLLMQMQGGTSTATYQQPQQTQSNIIHPLTLPPNPIPGAFGNYNDIKEGVSYRFQTKLPLDMTDMYAESGLDQIQVKFEISSLQLQNLECIHLLQMKEKEYASLANETLDIKEDLEKRCLLVQDELFMRYSRDKAQWDNKFGDLELRYKQQQELVDEQKIKLEKFTEYFDEVQKNDPYSMQAKLADMNKRSAILDVNLIKLSRKYEALSEEYKQIKMSFVHQQSEYIEKERDLLEKVNKLVGWKRQASAQLKILLSALQKSIPMETFHVTRQELEYSQDKLANIRIRESEQMKRFALLQNAERESYQKGERIRNLEEELTEIQLEGEIISKRLEALDPAFFKYRQVYVHIVDFIKIRNMSILQMFQQFDTNGDDYISKDEFRNALDNMGIRLTQDDIEVLFMFVDLDGTGVIEYQEFVRKLRRSGVSVRQKEENLLFTLYRAIQDSGLSLKSAFEAFDTNGDQVVSKQDMKEVLSEMKIAVQQEAIDYIFKIADSSGDNQISYDEFYNLFESIVKHQIQENQRTVNDELDWKMQVILKIDAAVKEQNLTLLDAFQMIDRNEDNTISLREFTEMFETMEIQLTQDAVKELFFTINRHNGPEITYNQLLNYLREAKTEEDKIRKLKALQERTKQLQDQSIQKDAQWDYSKASLMNQESRMQMKITILEMREKHAISRSAILIQQSQQQETLIKELNKQMEGMQKELEKCNQNYHKEREVKQQLKQSLMGSISKEESERLRRNNDRLVLQTEDLRSALTTYRNLYDTAVTQTKVMRLTIEKVKNDQDSMFETIKELQAGSDQNSTIGKLYHHVMVSRWNEGQTNQKLEQILDEQRKLKLQEASFEALMDERSKEIQDTNDLFRDTVFSYEKQISELKGKILLTVTLQRVEEQANRIKELADMKFEVEKQNRQLRDQFYELQLKADYFDVYKNALDELDLRLKTNNRDDLSIQIIQVSEKYSEVKILMLKAQRDVAIAREKEEYYQRLNRQYTDSIKQLEFDQAQGDLHLRKREEEWRKKFYEQRKTIFQSLGLEDVDLVNQNNRRQEENQQKMKEFLKSKDKESNKVSTDPELSNQKIQIEQYENDIKYKDIEIEGLNKRLKLQGNNPQNSSMFNQQQLEQYTKDILAQEGEKLSMAAQQTIRTLQEMNRDKDAQVDRKEQQLMQVKKEAMMHKKRDLEEIQRLNDLVYLKDREKLTEQINVPQGGIINIAESQGPIMLQQYQNKLKDKDDKIKDMQISLEAERKATKKLKDDLVRTLNDKEQLQQEMLVEQKKNEAEKYRKQVETLQKLVNSKNKELQSIKGTITQLKEEVFKVADESVKKEQEYSTKENKHSSTHSELEMRLKNMFTEIKSLKQDMKNKHEELNTLRIKEIEQKEIITDLKKQIEKLKATLVQGGFRLPSKDCQLEEDGIDASVVNISNKLQQLQTIQMENVSLAKEVQFLKSAGQAKNLFDKEGNLQSQHNQIYFKNVDELFEVLRLYIATKPKVQILAELEKGDKNKSRMIPLAKFFETLQMIGVKLKTRDQKLLIDYIKQEKGDQCDYYYKFFYKLKNYSDQSTITNELSEKAQKFAGK